MVRRGPLLGGLLVALCVIAIGFIRTGLEPQFVASDPFQIAIWAVVFHPFLNASLMIMLLAVAGVFHFWSRPQVTSAFVVGFALFAIYCLAQPLLFMLALFLLFSLHAGL
jgi:hypothetical protein